MKPKEPSCLNCALAKWTPLESGSPGSSGECMWVVPEIDIPMAYYGVSFDLSGGGIIRKNPYFNCPTYKPMEKEQP